MAPESSVAAAANREALFGTVPLLKPQRMYNLLDLVLVSGSFAIATWCYTQGAALASILSMPQALANNFGGILIATFLTCLIGAMSNRYGLDHFMLSRAVWGYFGAFVITPLALLVVAGFLSVNVNIYESSFAALLERAGLESAQSWWGLRLIGVTCPLIGLWIALEGLRAVQIATRVMGVTLVVIGTITVIVIFVRGNASEMWNSLPLGGVAADRSTYMLGAEWSIAFALSWYPCIGSLTRVVKDGRDSLWGLWIGYGALMAGYIFIGVAASFAAVSVGAEPNGDPTNYLLEIGGPWLGSLSLVLIGFANISTAAVGAYSMGITTKILWPSWNYKWVCVFWTCFMIAVVLWGEIVTYYGTFLAYIGIICGAGIALLVADYWVLRRQRIDVHSIFRPGRDGSYRYTGGFNIPAFIAFGAATAAYFAVYDPINYVPRITSVFNIFTASGLAALVSAGVYLALAAIPPVRRYLLADRDGQTLC